MYGLSRGCGEEDSKLDDGVESGYSLVFAGSSERGTMRAATHRCGRARARQTDFPPRSRSILHHSRSLILSLSPSRSLLPINYSLSSFVSTFCPCFRVALSCPLSSFTSVFVTFAPTASLRPACTLSPSPSPCLLPTFSPHSVQCNGGACTEWFVAQLFAQTRTLITRTH